MKKLIVGLNLLLVLAACEKQETKEAEAIEEPVAKQETAEAPKERSYAQVEIYRTAKGTDERFAQLSSAQFGEADKPVENKTSIYVDPTHTFQQFIGIGGALTDASAEIFASLPQEKQDELLTAYFDEEKGLGYTFTRTNIASCDFSSASYDYIEENDKELKTFDISHDKEYRIPFIKKALAMAGDSVKMFVSPWSPPAWMKDNGDRLNGGKLLDDYKQAWANHYIKFIEAYEAEGIPIWGLSVQNEPMAKQIWESCIFNAEDERDFVKNYLGPTLEKAGMSDKKLIVWDHNRDLIYQRAMTMFNDPEASKYVWGIGFHWYEPWKGGGMQFDNLQKVHETFPDKNLVFTEGCVEKFDYSRVNDWALGERYGWSMLNDFNNGTVAWTDWNILLDETGGPNHVGNLCFAPVHRDKSKKDLIYTNSYYYIGHFSKFIKPGAKRIISSSNYDSINTTAFLNPDGKVVVVILNKNEKKQEVTVWLNGKAIKTESLPHSIMTLVAS
ncbi:glycoside hydrolase family 30 protein [Fulvivirga ligni]|uniref:glycoside hydrolase family 30 protein n=1 Tax=Fulvivirga ligni TaxID=2904246 RepID=UPI001F1A8608|nr:glycoside hydrolase family 30 protein [Fulvivirga ligni]UII23165.1 hypothetical protein LVD16_07990 [Fulvivirga ligni]